MTIFPQITIFFSSVSLAWQITILLLGRSQFFC